MNNRNQSSPNFIKTSTPTSTPVSQSHNFTQELMNFQDKNVRLLREVKFEDDCKEFTKVYTVDNQGIKKTVLELGGGCIDYKIPRYVGFDGKLLYFTIYNENDFNTSTPNVETSDIKEVYSIDPFTLEQQLVITYPLLPKGVDFAEIVDMNSNFLALFDRAKGVYFFNLIDKKFYLRPN